MSISASPHFAGYPDQALWEDLLFRKLNPLVLLMSHSYTQKLVTMLMKSCVEIQVQCPEHVNPNYKAMNGIFCYKGPRGETHIYGINH